MRLKQITPLILTYNEAENIQRNLSRLQWASEIVVVDSYSSDSTVDIVEGDPSAKLYQRVFDRHADQWNYGLERVETEWVLSLDADYLCTSDFVRELEGLPENPREDGFEVEFLYVVFGKILRSSLYPPRVVLHRRDRTFYAQDGHTQRLSISGAVGKLSSKVLHDDRKPLTAWLEAQDRYTREEARKLQETVPSDLSRNDRWRSRFLGPLLIPPYCLVGKRLILDGRAGWYYTLQRTYAEVLLALRLLEADHPGSHEEESESLIIA